MPLLSTVRNALQACHISSVKGCLFQRWSLQEAINNFWIVNSKCVWTWCILGCLWSWTQLMNVCYSQCFLCLDTSIEIQDKFIFHQGWKDIVSHQRNRFLIEKLLQISLFLSNLVLIVTHRVLCLLWVLAANRFWVVASVPPHAENDVAKELF